LPSAGRRETYSRGAWAARWHADVRVARRSSIDSRQRPTSCPVRWPADPAEASSIWDDIWRLEAHNSTAIEGNTLVLREVERLLETGRDIGAKPLKDYLEVKGYGDAAQWVYAQASGAGHLEASAPITVTEVREVHRPAMAPVWK
jgi:hypothetical protein